MTLKIVEKIPLNWALLGNPVNWIMVWAMAGLGYAGLMLILSQTGKSPGNNSGD